MAGEDIITDENKNLTENKMTKLEFLALLDTTDPILLAAHGNTGDLLTISRKLRAAVTDPIIGDTINIDLLLAAQTPPYIAMLTKYEEYGDLLGTDPFH